MISDDIGQKSYSILKICVYDGSPFACCDAHLVIHVHVAMSLWSILYNMRMALESRNVLSLSVAETWSSSSTQYSLHPCSGVFIPGVKIRGVFVQVFDVRSVLSLFPQ